jgi:hypothetical protein
MEVAALANFFELLGQNVQAFLVAPNLENFAVTGFDHFEAEHGVPPGVQSRRL